MGELTLEEVTADIRSRLMGMRHVAYGDTGKYWRWLEKELPPDVSRHIYSIKHHGKEHPHTKRRIEISFYPRCNVPPVVVKRKGFKSPATLTLICLLAP